MARAQKRLDLDHDRSCNPDRGPFENHLHLDDQGRVRTPVFTSPSFAASRSSAKAVHFTEMPSLMARICGICPVSHLIASAKACDALMAVRIPPTADKLRRIVRHGSGRAVACLSLFHLSSPDLLLRHGR